MRDVQKVFFLFAILLIGCSDGESPVTPTVDDKDNNKDSTANPKQEIDLLKTIPYKQLDGVDQNLLNLDVYYTDNLTDMKPVVVWIHGGAFVTGDKSNNIQAKVRLYKENGWILVSVNYRLSPNDAAGVNDPNKIKYPDHNNDVADAIKWIYDSISSYGGNNSKLVLHGHSAGAHLVALTGTRRELLESRGVPFSILKGVIASDTKTYDIRSMVLDEVPFVVNAFGTDEAENLEASPIENIISGKPYPNFFIAKRGTPDRIKAADTFIAKLQDNEVIVSQVTASNYTHEEINQLIGTDGETQVTIPIVNFIKFSFGESN